MALKTYLQTLSLAERAELAERCGTTAGHLRNVMYGDRQCSAELAIALERETGGAITVEQIRSDIDWAVVRGSAQTAA